MGRPSDYSWAKACEICAWISAGRSLNSYCEQPGAPTIPTVYNWIAAHPEFFKLYVRAREEQADTLADEIVKIADDSALTPDDRRVRIDARKWISMKLKPRSYGDKQQVDVNVTNKPEELTDEQLADIAAGGRAGTTPTSPGSKSTH